MYVWSVHSGYGVPPSKGGGGAGSTMQTWPGTDGSSPADIVKLQQEIDALYAEMDQSGVSGARLAELRALQAQLAAAENSGSSPLDQTLNQQLAQAQAQLDTDQANNDQTAVKNDQAKIDAIYQILYAQWTHHDQAAIDSAYAGLQPFLAQYGIVLKDGDSISNPDDLKKIQDDPNAKAAYDLYEAAIAKYNSDAAQWQAAFTYLQLLASNPDTADVEVSAIDTVNKILESYGFSDLAYVAAIDPKKAEQQYNDAVQAAQYRAALSKLWDAQVADDAAHAQLAADHTMADDFVPSYEFDSIFANDVNAVTQADSNLQQAENDFNSLQKQLFDQASPELKKELGLDLAQQNLKDAQANLAAVENLPAAQRRLELADAEEWVSEAEAQLAEAQKGNWKAVTQFSPQELQQAISDVQNNHQGEMFGPFSASDLINQNGWEFAVNQEISLIQSAPDAYLTPTEKALLNGTDDKLNDQKIDIQTLALIKLMGVSINNDADAKIALQDPYAFIYMKLGNVSITTDAKGNIDITIGSTKIDPSASDNPYLSAAIQSFIKNKDPYTILLALMGIDPATGLSYGKPYITLDPDTQIRLQNLIAGTQAARLDYVKAQVQQDMGGPNPTKQQQTDALDVLGLAMQFAFTPGERAQLWEEAGAPYFTKEFFEKQFKNIAGNVNTNVTDPNSSGMAIDKIGEYLQDLLGSSHGSYELAEVILSAIKDSYNDSWYQYVNSGGAPGHQEGTNFYKALSMAVQIAYRDPYGDPNLPNEWAQWLTANDGNGVSIMQKISGMDNFSVNNAVMDGYPLLSEAVEGIFHNSKSFYAQQFNADYTYTMQDYQNAQNYLNANNFNAKTDVPVYFNQFKNNPSINNSITVNADPNNTALVDMIGDALGFVPTDPNLADDKMHHRYNTVWFAKGTQERAIIDLIIGWIRREGGATPTITILPMIYTAPGAGVQYGALIQIQTKSATVYVDGLAAEQAVAAANSNLTPDQIAADNNYQEVSPNADFNVEWHYSSLNDYQDNNQLAQSGTIYLPQNTLFSGGTAGPGYVSYNAHNWSWKDTANVVIGAVTTLAFIAAPFTGGASLFVAGGAGLLAGGWGIYSGIDELETMDSHGESTNPFKNGQAFSAYLNIGGGVAMAAMPFAGVLGQLGKFAQLGVDLAPEISAGTRTAQAGVDLTTESGAALTTGELGTDLAPEASTAAPTAGGAGKIPLLRSFVSPKALNAAGLALLKDSSLASTFLEQYGPIIKAARVLGVVNTGLGAYYTGQQVIGLAEGWDTMTPWQRVESGALLGLGLVQMGISPVMEHLAQKNAQNAAAGFATEFLVAPKTATAQEGSSKLDGALWAKYGAWMPKGKQRSPLTVADDATFNDAYLAAGGKGDPNELGAFIVFKEGSGEPLSIYIRDSVMSSPRAAFAVGHELLHLYSNSRFRAFAQSLGLGSGDYANLYEGATELLNFKLSGPKKYTGRKEGGYAAYLKSLKASDPLRNNQYADQTLAAEKIFDRIGADNFYKAYFQGDKTAITAFEQAAWESVGDRLKTGDASQAIAAQLQPGNNVFPMPADMSRVNPANDPNLNPGAKGPGAWTRSWKKLFFGRPRTYDQLRADHGLAPDTSTPSQWAMETADLVPVLGRLIDMVADIHAHSRPYDHRSGEWPEKLVAKIGIDGRILIGDIPQHCGTPHYSSAYATALTIDKASLLDKTNAQAFLDMYEKDRALAAKFDLSMTGFNPGDPNAMQYVRDMLLEYPGVFKFIGEITLQKEMVAAMLGKEATTFDNPVAIDNFKNLLALANRTGLGVLIHCDWGPAENGDDGRPKETINNYSFLGDLIDLVKQFPQANIILAHAGNGRFVRPDDTLVGYTIQNGPMKGAILTDIPKQIAMMEWVLDEAPHVRFDISWNDVGEMYATNPALRQGLRDFILRHPDRVLFGSDTVKPVNKAQYMQAFTTLLPFLADLAKADPQALYKLLRGNYDTVVTNAEDRLHAWAQPLLTDPQKLVDMIARFNWLRGEHDAMKARAYQAFTDIMLDFNNRTPNNPPQGVPAGVPQPLTAGGLGRFFLGDPSPRRAAPGAPNTRMGVGTPHGVPPTPREVGWAIFNSGLRGGGAVALGALFITHPELIPLTNSVVAGASTIVRNAIFLSQVYYREFGVRLPWEEIFEEGNAIDRNIDKFINRVLNVGRTLGVEETDLKKVLDLTGDFRAAAGYTWEFWKANKPNLTNLTPDQAAAATEKWHNDRFINLMGVIGRYQTGVDRAIGEQAASLDVMDPRTNLGGLLRDISSLTLVINMINLAENIDPVSAVTVAAVLNEIGLGSFLTTNVAGASGTPVRANFEDTNAVIRGLRVLTWGGIATGGAAGAVSDALKAFTGDPAAALTAIPKAADAVFGGWAGLNELRKYLHFGATSPTNARRAAAGAGWALVATGLFGIIYALLKAGSNGRQPTTNPSLTPTPTPTQTPTPTPVILPPTSFPTSPQNYIPGNPNPAGYNAGANGANYVKVTPVNGGEPGTVLPAGLTLHLGEHYSSPNGKYELVMQYDGDLVLYRNNSNGTQTKIFETGTYENNPYGLGVGDHAVIQSDGNLVVYGFNTDGDKPGDAVWASNTGSTADAYSVLAIQDDGNLAIYAKDGATWDAQDDSIDGRLVGDTDPVVHPPRYG